MFVHFVGGAMKRGVFILVDVKHQHCFSENAYCTFKR